jgi:hypothetical protein
LAGFPALISCLYLAFMSGLKGRNQRGHGDGLADVGSAAADEGADRSSDPTVAPQAQGLQDFAACPGSRAPSSGISMSKAKAVIAETPGDSSLAAVERAATLSLS